MARFWGKKSNSASSLREEEKMKYLARELVSSLEAKYASHENSIKERISEGLDDPSFSAYEEKQRISLDVISKFLNRLLGGSDASINSALSNNFDWKRVKKLVDGVAALDSPKVRSLVSDLYEVTTYYADLVNAGNFIMMPDATIESSKSYRGYLLGNKINGDNSWGWEKDEKTQFEFADNSYSQLLGRFLTSVHDKAGANKVLISACFFTITLISAWETGRERHSLSVLP
jgi:hypothetical protein